MVPALLFWALAHTSAACGVVGVMRLGPNKPSFWSYSPARAADQHCRPFVCCLLIFFTRCLPSQTSTTCLCACVHNCVCVAVTTRTNSRGHGPTSLGSPWSCACCSTQNSSCTSSTAAAHCFHAPQEPVLAPAHCAAKAERRAWVGVWHPQRTQPRPWARVVALTRVVVAPAAHVRGAPAEPARCIAAIPARQHTPNVSGLRTEQTPAVPVAEHKKAAGSCQLNKTKQLVGQRVTAVLEQCRSSAVLGSTVQHSLALVFHIRAAMLRAVLAAGQGRTAATHQL